MPDRIFSQISLPAVYQMKITSLFKRHIRLLILYIHFTDEYNSDSVMHRTHSLSGNSGGH